MIGSGTAGTWVIAEWETFIRTLENYSFYGTDTEENPHEITYDDWDIAIVGEDGAVYDEIPRTGNAFNIVSYVEII